MGLGSCVKAGEPDHSNYLKLLQMKGKICLVLAWFCPKQTCQSFLRGFSIISNTFRFSSGLIHCSSGQFSPLYSDQKFHLPPPHYFLQAHNPLFHHMLGYFRFLWSIILRIKRLKCTCQFIELLSDMWQACLTAPLVTIKQFRVASKITPSWGNHQFPDYFSLNMLHPAP